MAIIDLFSRKVVGWALGGRLDAELSTLALRRALARRAPPPGLVFHSDRGIEFAARVFREVLGEGKMLQSMSRKGNCWDNAVSESFFSTLEFEGPDPSTWRHLSDAEPELFTFYRGLRQPRKVACEQWLQDPERGRSRPARWCVGRLNKVSTKSGQAQIDDANRLRTAFRASSPRNYKEISP